MDLDLPSGNLGRQKATQLTGFFVFKGLAF
jgi:hypothetical protein